MDNTIDNTEEASKSPMKVIFTSQIQCAAKTGISTQTLREAKKHGAPGFKGSCVQWHILKPWLDDHKDLIEKKVEDNLRLLTIEGKRLDNDIKRLEKKKRQGEYLDPKDISDFLLKLRLTFESVLNGWGTELPPKWVGKSLGEIEDSFKNEKATFISTFKEQIESKIKECLPKK